jgi:non-ribosomal peptide synthetase component F
MTLLAAFQILLHYLTRQNDIVVGTDVANRNRAETEALVGFFVNQLVLRTDLSGNPTFRELLKRVRAVTLEGYAHQDLPFERLVDIGRLTYSTDLFEATSIAQLLAHFETLLDDIVLRPDARLDVLEAKLAEVDQRQQIVQEEALEATRLEKFQKLRRKAIEKNVP